MVINTNQCVCGNTEFKPSLIDEIPLGECLNCGVIKQMNVNIEDYNKYYREEYPPTKNTYIDKEWKEVKTANKDGKKLDPYGHDRELSKVRCDAYGLTEDIGKIKILDVGTGSGAFVDECRARGFESYGCEISHYSYVKENEFIYYDNVEDINFPTDDFDFVTCHDVLEHVLDPVKFLKELFRITKQEGSCIIDFPDYFNKAGRHHWKSTEHIWFFKEVQLIQLLNNIGFVVDRVEKPIESKLVFYLQKPKQERVKILVPPGMGDSVWSIMKLQSFMKMNDIKSPADVYIVCTKERKYNGHKRSVPFLKLFPFIKCTGKVYQFSNSPTHKKLWKEAYSKVGRSVFENVLGCDYFISYNGHVIGNKRLENADKYECNWYPPMFVSLEQRKYIKEYARQFGKYIVLYFPFYGMYTSWVKKFSYNKLADSINKIVEITGFTPVFAGAAWDKDDTDCKRFRKNITDAIDLTGQTTVDQVFALIKSSQGLIGFPSGLPIMSTVLGQKTLILWDNHWKEDEGFADRFASRCCPPDTVGKTYQYKIVDNLTVQDLVQSSLNLFSPDYENSKFDEVINKRSEIAEQEIIPMAPEKRHHHPRHQIVPTKPAKSFDSSIVITCMLKDGDGYDYNYVTRLHNMLKRNSTVLFDFCCLTDNINIESNGINVLPLKNKLDGTWSKLELFRPGMFSNAKRIIYFDLDTVIIGNIDDLIQTENNIFMGMRPWNEKLDRDNYFNSNIMSWTNNGILDFLYNNIKKANPRRYLKGNQEFISEMLKRKKIVPTFLQDEFCGIYSYKRHCKRFLPNNARIVCFHGKPKPERVSNEWMTDNWY